MSGLRKRLCFFWAQPLSSFCFIHRSIRFPCLIEQLCHGGIASCQLLNRQRLGLVVGQAQVVLAADERILDFLH